MTYKVGDKVWYLDTKSQEVPKIKQDVIIKKLNSGRTFYQLKNYLQNTNENMVNEQLLFLTKEDLLKAINPPLHNFVVGQTVWYIENDDDPDTLRVEKACVISTTNETIEISISHPCVPNFTIEDLEIIFASPKEAVTKALELKQW